MAEISICSGFQKKQRHCNNFTNMQNGGGTRNPTFKQLDHREKMRNYEKEKSTNVVTVILPKAFFLFVCFLEHQKLPKLPSVARFTFL